MEENNNNIPKSVEIMRRISSKEFSEYFYKNIYPKLGKYEKQRKSAVRFDKFMTIIFIFVCCFFVICLGIYLKVVHTYADVLSILFPMICVLLVFCLLCIIRFYAPRRKTIQSDLKFELLPDLLNFAGSDFKINMYGTDCVNFSDRMRFINHTIGETDISEFKDLPIFHDIYKLTSLIVDDYVTGKYNSVPVVMIDVYVVYKKVALFNGLIVKIPVNKKFTSPIYINSQSTSVNNLLNVNLNMDTSIKPQIHLEDPVFEKYFDVYADDQVEARYILTTGFMNRLVSIASKNKNSTVSCSFIDGYMYLALDGKDWFDIPSGKSFSEIGNWQRVLVDFIDMFRIIDELKVEQNIGM